MAEGKIEQFEKFVAQYPDQPFARYALALEYRKAGRLEDALATFAALQARAPDYVACYLMAGQTAQQAGKTDEARGWYERGLAAAQKKGDAHAASELSAALEALQ